MTNLFTYLFNWKKHPASVFIFMWPLVILFFGLYLTVAYLQWRDNGRWGFMVIDLVALAVLVFCLRPVWGTYKRLMAHEQEKHDAEQ